MLTRLTRAARDFSRNTCRGWSGAWAQGIGLWPSSSYHPLLCLASSPRLALRSDSDCHVAVRLVGKARAKAKGGAEEETRVPSSDSRAIAVSGSPKRSIRDSCGSGPAWSRGLCHLQSPGQGPVIMRLGSGLGGSGSSHLSSSRSSCGEEVSLEHHDMD